MSGGKLVRREIFPRRTDLLPVFIGSHHNLFAISWTFPWRRVPGTDAEANLPIPPGTGDLNQNGCFFEAIAGRLWQAFHWLCKGLADYNPSWANPSDVGANNAYHNPPLRVVAKGPAKAPFGTRQTRTAASSIESALLASPVSLAWTGTYLHGCMQLSRCVNAYFPVHSIAAGKGCFVTKNQKYFFSREIFFRTAASDAPTFLAISL